MILESLSFTIVFNNDLTGSSSVQLPPVELAGYFPYLPKDGSMPEEERLQHLSKLYRESDKIKTRFTSLLFHLQEDLEKNSKLDMYKVVNLLVFYGIHEDELCDCTSITLVFRKIRKFISFFDYQLVKILAKYFGSKASKKKFVKYKLHFQEFAKCHICECPSDLFDENEMVDSIIERPQKTYVIKIDKSVEILTLEELETLKCKMNEILGHKFLKVVKVEDGCVQVTFRTFGSSDFVISDEQQRGLSSLGVIIISCGSESVHIPTVSSLENKADSGITYVAIVMILKEIILCNYNSFQIKVVTTLKALPHLLVKVRKIVLLLILVRSFIFSFQVKGVT